MLIIFENTLMALKTKTNNKQHFLTVIELKSVLRNGRDIFFQFWEFSVAR